MSGARNQNPIILEDVLMSSTQFEQSDDYSEQLFCTACDDTSNRDFNKIRTCNVCNTCVHEQCYMDELTINNASSDWTCSRCIESQKKNISINCYVCPQAHLIIKNYDISENKRIKSVWAHVSCINFIVMTNFNFSLKDKQGTCSLCRKREGFLLICAKEKCYKKFHIGCAKVDALLVNKSAMEVIRRLMASRSKQQLLRDARVYCASHWNNMQKVLVGQMRKISPLNVDKLLRAQSDLDTIKARLLRKQWYATNTTHQKFEDQLEKVEKIENISETHQKSRSETIIISDRKKQRETTTQKPKEKVTLKAREKAPSTPRRKSVRKSPKRIYKKPSIKVRKMDKNFEEELMDLYKQETDRVYGECLSSFWKKNKSDLLQRNNITITVNPKISSLLFGSIIEIQNMDAFYEYFTAYLLLNGLVCNNRVVFTAASTSETVRTWKAIAESKDILENIKLEDFIYKIRDAFMRGEDKDEFTASQYDLINQLISDSESVHIL